MENSLRFMITTNDRIGITVEVLEVVNNKNIDLKSMEVFHQKICIKIEYISNCIKKSLMDEIKNIKDVISIIEIDLLNYEENHRKLLTVIDLVDEGIIAIDKNYKINIYNSYCESLFNYPKNEIIGEDIYKLLGEKSPLAEIIENSARYDNVTHKVKNNNSEVSYITTGRPILDDNNNTIGAVATLKDINKTKELVDIIQKSQDAFKHIIGNSNSIEKVKKIITNVAKSNSTVLLRGESGTGKELFAKVIHTLSNRKDKRYVTINCAALPDTLLESELFGYERGSFTGAINSGKNGLFQEADGGTLFLDEIGELSMFIQAKLLRVLQEGVVRRIGSSKEEKIDVRILAATNKNLEDMICKGTFRKDLYFRLNVIPVHIPPLRERKEDIPLLVDFFVKKLCNKLGRNIEGIDNSFINELMQYDWVGNVRELQNIIERSIVLCEDNILKNENNAKNVYTDNSFLNTNVSNEEKIVQLDLKDTLDKYEKEILKKIIAKYKSSRKAAKVLGVSHTTIINKIKKYNL